MKHFTLSRGNHVNRRFPGLWSVNGAQCQNVWKKQCCAKCASLSPLCLFSASSSVSACITCLLVRGMQQCGELLHGVFIFFHICVASTSSNCILHCLLSYFAVCTKLLYCLVVLFCCVLLNATQIDSLSRALLLPLLPWHSWTALGDWLTTGAAD